MRKRMTDFEIWRLMGSAWFLLLERSLIIGTLYFLKEKTDNIVLGFLFWVSWIIFYLNIETTIDQVDFGVKSRRLAILIRAIIVLPILLLMYELIINVTDTFL